LYQQLEAGRKKFSGNPSFARALRSGTYRPRGEGMATKVEGVTAISHPGLA